MSGKLERYFIDQLERIVWQYKLAPETINLPARPGVAEIQVFDLKLKVGAAYTIDPYIRTPQAVLDALFRKPRRLGADSSLPRPKPVAKHVRASLSRNAQGTMEPSYQENTCRMRG